MSTYVLLTQVNSEDRDNLLTPTQNQLDRAENIFLKLLNDREMTADDVAETVPYEVTEYIIATTFYLCAIAGMRNNLGIIDQRGSAQDPYEFKRDYYQDQMKELDVSLTYEVVSGNGSSVNAMARIAVPKIVRA